MTFISSSDFALSDHVPLLLHTQWKIKVPYSAKFILEQINQNSPFPLWRISIKESLWISDADHESKCWENWWPPDVPLGTADTLSWITMRSVPCHWCWEETSLEQVDESHEEWTKPARMVKLLTPTQFLPTNDMGSWTIPFTWLSLNERC